MSKANRKQRSEGKNLYGNALSIQEIGQQQFHSSFLGCFCPSPDGYSVLEKDRQGLEACTEENWSQAQCRETAEDVTHSISLDQTGFGAFDGERIIGFATVSHRVFGAAARYVQLVCFQISEEYRRQGIGRKLFSLACEEARRLGADKLYISAHSSKESQAAYRALGCSFAEEINAELAAAEPFDVQMEYKL